MSGPRRHASHEEETNHDRWLVSYADFITLMFAFFVVMYAISSVSEGKYRVLSDALMQAFDKEDSYQLLEPSPIDLPIEQRARLEESQADAEKRKVTGEEELADDMLDETKGELAEKVEDPAVVEDRVKKSLGEIADDIRYELFPFIDEQLISVTNTDTRIEVEIKSQLLFASGSARLVSEAIPVLSNLALLFSTFKNSINVEGFTDDQPINTIAFPSNWELSTARAASVVHLFMKKGIDPKRMSASGYAEFRPVADNSTEEGRQKNRRVTIIIPTVPNERESIQTN